MSRKYVKIDVYGKEILELKREGKTNREIAQKLGVDRKCIRNWVFRFNRQQRKLAAGIKLHPKGRPRKDAQPRDIVAEQAYEINRLKMENELLRDFMRSMERKWKPSFKYAVIHRHRTKYAVKDLCEILQVSRSGYYKYVKHLNHTAKDFDLAEKIRTKQESCKKTYGYRRMKLWLDSEGITKNPKTILRIMHKYDLLSEIRRRKRWRKMGEDKHRYDNWLNREFNAEHPNQKWVTDISYIQTQEGVLYLSMIRDLYDRSIVAYRTGTSQTINLVLDTIHLAMKSVKTESRRELHLHSDQGFQYNLTSIFRPD